MVPPLPSDDRKGASKAGAARLARTLARRGWSGRLALAVSGGPDSLALLLLMAGARPGDIVAATVDHGLRPDAAAEAATVGAVCAGLGVPHATLRVSIEGDAGALQARARAARYAALGRWAVAQGATHLATAHHGDDRAETLLMRLARGSGVGGLGGIRAARALPEAPGVMLIRPLLDWRKAELAAIVAAAGLVPVDDPSNRDPRHDRTAFRGLLTREPLLDPARLAASAAHLADAEDALAWMAARLWEERARVAEEMIVLDVAGIPRELRRRLLAHALPDARGDALARLMDRLDGGAVGTLGRHVVRPHGARWTISEAPPRLSG